MKTIEDKIYRLLYFVNIGEGKGFGRRYQEIKMFLLGRLNYFITKKAIKVIKPDIVYAGQVTGISLYPIKAIQQEQIPIVQHLGNYFFIELIRDCILRPNSFKRFYRKFIFGFFNAKEINFKHLITVSEAVKQKYVESGFFEDDISVIPPRGIPLELIKKESKKISYYNKKKLKLLYIGRIEKTKGIHIAIKAVGYLINSLGMRNLTLDIIGIGNKEYIEELKTLTSNLKLNKYVILKGHVPYELILKEYTNGDILLVPSIWEDPSPSVVLEAMSQGVPVIASNVGGIHERICHMKTGFLVPPNSSKDMAEAIRKLIANPSLYEKISINGINEVRAKYTNEKIIEQIDEYISKIHNSI